jgi:hypothetical protein
LDEIQAIYWSIRTGSRVADEWYIWRVLPGLEDCLFFSLYSYSCLAKQVKTLEGL